MYTCTQIHADASQLLQCTLVCLVCCLIACLLVCFFLALSSILFTADQDTQCVKVTGPNDSDNPSRTRGKMHYVLSSELLCVVVVCSAAYCYVVSLLYYSMLLLIVCFSLCLLTNQCYSNLQTECKTDSA